MNYLLKKRCNKYTMINQRSKYNDLSRTNLLANLKHAFKLWEREKDIEFYY